MALNSNYYINLTHEKDTDKFESFVEEKNPIPKDDLKTFNDWKLFHKLKDVLEHNTTKHKVLFYIHMDNIEMQINQ